MTRCVPLQGRKLRAESRLFYPENDSSWFFGSAAEFLAEALRHIPEEKIEVVGEQMQRGTSWRKGEELRDKRRKLEDELKHSYVSPDTKLSR